MVDQTLLDIGEILIVIFLWVVCILDVFYLTVHDFLKFFLVFIDNVSRSKNIFLVDQHA